MSSCDRPDTGAARVSRETPAPPAVAAELFGDRLVSAARYAELLCRGGVDRGLLGGREASRIWERHLLNCAVVTPAIPNGSTVCDVGSGGGLPGIVVSLVRPDLEVTLLDSRRGRAVFLREAVAVLGLARCTVVHERAEIHREHYDVVLARALAPLGEVARLTMPLCNPTGFVLAMKGSRAGSELAEASDDLVRYGVGRAVVERWGSGLVDPATTVVRLTPGPVSGRSGATRGRVRRSSRRRG